MVPPKGDAMKVYCKVCTMINDDTCIESQPCNIVCNHPANGSSSCIGFRKRTVCTFDRVFDEETTNKDLFDEVVLPLVKDFIAANNGMVFVRETSEREKSYVMKGWPSDGGIVPRCLDVIFNSISNQQAKKSTFKPDNLNGFEVQTDADAERDRRQELHILMKALQIEDMVNKECILPEGKFPGLLPGSAYQSCEAEEPNISPDCTRVPGINENNICAIFVSSVHMCDNGAYDALDADNKDKGRNMQAKILRIDGQQRMYVHGAKEVEVKTSAEAFEWYLKGQASALDIQSVNCHTVFTIRLVQTVHGDAAAQQEEMSISQLSFVDIAGRICNPSMETKPRGRINNSISCLRKCLEILRENELQGTSTRVPYRESKLTYLFKNYFDGDGRTRLLTCITPLTEDLEETLKVLAFAKSTKEMYMTVPSAATMNYRDPTSLESMVKKDQRSAGSKDTFEGQTSSEDEDSDKDHKSTEEHNVPVETSTPTSIPGTSGFTTIPSAFPCLEMKEPTDTLTDVIGFLHQRFDYVNTLKNTIASKQQAFREAVHDKEIDYLLARHELDLVRTKLQAEKEMGRRLSKKNQDMEAKQAVLQEMLKQKEGTIIETNKQMKHLEQCAREARAERRRVHKQMKLELQRVRKEAEMKLEKKQHELETLKYKVLQKATNDKIQNLMKTLDSDSESTSSDNAPEALGMPLHSEESIPQSQKNLESGRNLMKISKQNPQKMEHMYQHRRSQSAGEDVWLTHQSGMVPKTTGTVFKPHLKCTRSIAKLPAAEEVARHKVSKYCLLTQEPNPSGDLETRVYKVIGHKEGLTIMEQTDPLVLLVGLPTIPIMLILGKMVRWEDSVLALLRRHSYKFPILKHLFPPAGEEARANAEVPPLSDPVSATRVLCSALLFPSVATIVGKLFFDYIPSSFQRTLLGGLAYIAGKGVLKIYHKQQQFVRLSKRKILNFTNTDAKE